MRVNKTVDFQFSGNKLLLDEVEEILSEAKSLGAHSIRIDQTNYNDPPYGSSTSTTITIERANNG